MEQPWIIRPSSIPAPELIEAAGGNLLVAQLLFQRGFDTPGAVQAFLDPDHYVPAPPTALHGVQEASHLIADTIRRNRNILVWGDFDVDGQTSTSLLVAALHSLAGRGRIRYHIPNRLTEGHGIHPDNLASILDTMDVPIDLLLTCDTGIAEGDAIGYAKDRGLTVVVTDHHDPAPEFRDLDPLQVRLWGYSAHEVGQNSVRRADALVNPKFLPPDDPLRALPGVGVAYKLVQQLYRLAGHAGDEQSLLDLVALGIVADVAEQINDVRYLLQRGLEKLRNTRRVGLLALMDVARISPEQVTAESIGFQIGPRMNALGRLQDATAAVELLTTQDPVRAGQLAAQMERLNQERRLLSSQTTSAAMDIIERNPDLLDFNALVLAHPAWHSGIVGIVAARLAEEYNRPTVLLINPPGQPARGSARSVAGIDIGSAIAACEPMLLTYGGHPGAAGLSLPETNINAFRRELSRQVELHRTADTKPGLWIDAEIPLTALDLGLADELHRLAPFGQGNPIPILLTRTLQVVEDRRIGQDGTHRRLQVADRSGQSRSVIWFHGADAELPSGPIDLAYHAHVNEYRGEREVQMHCVAVRVAQMAEQEPTPAIIQAVPIHDLRGQEPDPASLPSPDQANWYAEGIHVRASTETEPGEVAFAPRSYLPSAPRNVPLVIWSVPPSTGLLHWLVETTQPNELYLCGHLSTDDQLSGVLRQVAGMCKYALQQDGTVHIDRMAARLGTTEGVIRHSLLWLESRGLIAIQAWDPPDLPGDSICITPGQAEDDREDSALLRAELDSQLAEVRAYRRFFLRARSADLGLKHTDQGTRFQ